MPQLSAAKALQNLAQGQVAPLYLLFGEETYLMQEHTTALIERILGTASRDFNCDILQADSETLSEALSIASTLPMMATYRVVVFHNVQQLRQADWQRLDAYAAQPSESTVLICTSTESDVAKTPARFVQRAVVIECKRLEGSALHAWITHTVTHHGCTITEAALQELMREQQNDLWLLAQEIAKLCTYAGDTKTLTPADIHAVCQTSRQPSIFAISDAIGARQMLTALSVVDSLLSQGEAPLVIFSMMVRHLRLLWSVVQLTQQRHEASQIAKSLGLPLAVCRRLVTQSRLFAPERLQQLYAAAVEADLAFKTSARPPRAILEGLILEFCLRS
jgi:DNA polymerase III subunit delta